MNRVELIEKLQRIDENIHFSGSVDPGTRAATIIVGASALLLCNLSHKNVTKDVDIYYAEQCIQEELYKDPDFNSQCGAYAQCLPYNFEDRLVKIDLETFVIDVYTPSKEDLAVMKLYRWEKPDKDDLTAPEFLRQLDWDMLDYLVHSPEEAAASRSAEPEKDRELLNLRFNYEQYEKEWRK